MFRQGKTITPENIYLTVSNLHKAGKREAGTGNFRSQMTRVQVQTAATEKDHLPVPGEKLPYQLGITAACHQTRDVQPKMHVL